MNDTFAKWALGIVASLCVAGILGGIKLYADMAVLKTKLESVTADSALDIQQSETISRLWQAASANRDNINALREQANSDHPERAPLPAFTWDIHTP